jgi:hypothetical protein
MGGLKDTEKSVKDVMAAPGKAMADIEKLKQVPGNEITKSLSPLMKKKQEIEAAKAKAEAPLKLMQQKQEQMKRATEAARKKADAAARLLEAKQFLQQRNKSENIGAIADQKSLADRAKNGVDGRMRDVKSKGDAVTSLIEKIEAQAKQAVNK